jgi:hypothetical protein
MISGSGRACRLYLLLESRTRKRRIKKDLSHKGTKTRRYRERTGIMSKRSYEDAAKAMQSGVAALMGIDPSETTPKHLRVGVNVTLRDHGSLIGLLIKKGIITKEEYLEAITAGMNEEAEGYEKKLSESTGSKVRLG